MRRSFLFLVWRVFASATIVTAIFCSFAIYLPLYFDVITIIIEIKFDDLHFAVCDGHDSFCGGAVGYKTGPGASRHAELSECKRYKRRRLRCTD